MNLGKTLGLIHSQPCKTAYRTWSKNPSVETRDAMVKAKADCALCAFKQNLRKEQIKAVKAGTN